jgi:hypothetical protein
MKSDFYDDIIYEIEEELLGLRNGAEQQIRIAISREESQKARARLVHVRNLLRYTRMACIQGWMHSDCMKPPSLRGIRQRSDSSMNKEVCEEMGKEGIK